MKHPFWKDPKFTYILLPFLLVIPVFVLLHPDTPVSLMYARAELQSLLCFAVYFFLPVRLIYRFVRTEKRVSQILILELAAAATGYYLLMQDREDAWLFTDGAIILLVLSLYPLLQKLSSASTGGSGEDWVFLARVYRWSAVFSYAVSWVFPRSRSPYVIIVYIAFAAVMAGILLILPGGLRKPLTAGGWLGIVGTLAISVLLLTECCTIPGWPIYLLLVMFPYAFMALRLWGREYPDSVQEHSPRSE